MRWIFHRHGISSMIILKVDVADSRALDPEGQSEIACNCQAPDTLPVTLQGMQLPAWNRFKLTHIFRLLNSRQHRTKLCLVLPRDTASFVTSPESFKVSMPET